MAERAGSGVSRWQRIRCFFAWHGRQMVRLSNGDWFCPWCWRTHGPETIGDGA